MRINRLLFAASLVFMLLCFSGTSHAQNMLISEMDDINLGTWGGGQMNGNDAVCVYKSSGNDRYRVTGTDDSTITPTGFRLENAAGTVEITYRVDWSNNTSPGNLTLTDGTARNVRSADRVSQTCGGGDTNNFEIIVTAANLTGKPAGTYTATVSFMVQPP